MEPQVYKKLWSQCQEKRTMFKLYPTERSAPAAGNRHPGPGEPRTLKRNQTTLREPAKGHGENGKCRITLSDKAVRPCRREPGHRAREPRRLRQNQTNPGNRQRPPAKIENAGPSSTLSDKTAGPCRREPRTRAREPRAINQTEPIPGSQPRAPVKIENAG